MGVAHYAINAATIVDSGQRENVLMNVSTNLAMSAEELASKGQFKKSLKLAKTIPSLMVKSKLYLQISKLSLKKGLSKLSLVTIETALTSAQSIPQEKEKEEFLAAITEWLIQSAKASQNPEMALKLVQKIPDQERKTKMIRELKKDATIYSIRN